MHTAAKVLLILGTIVTVIGIAGFAIGIGQIDDVSDSWNNFEVEDGTNGTITIDDSDGQGELGLTFWVKGVYEDLDENGIWDVCDITNVEVTENPEIIVSEWQEPGAASLDGKFYNEVMWNYDENSTSDCKAVRGNEDNSREDNGLVKIGRACYGCGSGDFVFESNQSVWVTYDDKIVEDLEESGLLLGLGFIGGFGAMCCGVLLLIIGGFMASTFRQYDAGGDMPPANNQMISNNDQGVAPLTITTPNVTHMSAPTFDEPPQGGL